MLTLAATLPLVIAMVKRPALFNGIRHFIFVIPPMTVLAGLAFCQRHELARGEAPQLAGSSVGGAARVGLLLPFGEMIRLHPYQYTHFNHIAGTVRAADNYFMLDYWGLALKQASDELREQLRPGSGRRKIASGKSPSAARSGRPRSHSAPISPSAGTANPPISP